MTINKQGLAAELELHEVFENKSQKYVVEFIEDFFESIAVKVSENTEVSIAGFGKFEPFTLASGVMTPKFRPFEAFKAKLN